MIMIYTYSETRRGKGRWKDYFATLLESDQNSNTQVPGQRLEQRRNQDANQLDSDCTEISVEEVCECIVRLKNRKAVWRRSGALVA